MKVNVTQDDIDNGTPGTPLSCPVAQAIRREHPDLSLVSVGFTMAALGRPGAEAIWCIPDELTEWIQRFDDGEDVEPFTAELVSA